MRQHQYTCPNGTMAAFDAKLKTVDDIEKRCRIFALCILIIVFILFVIGLLNK